MSASLYCGGESGYGSRNKRRELRNIYSRNLALATGDKSYADSISSTRMLASNGSAAARSAGGSTSVGSGSVAQRRQLSTSAEPSMFGTSWASVRWNRPVSGPSIGYRSSRFLGGTSLQSNPVATSFASGSVNTGKRPISPSPVAPRQRTSNVTTSTNNSGGSSPADRYIRNTVLESVNVATSRPGVGYLSSRTPARAALMDIRQNLRPVRKNSEQKYLRPMSSALSPVNALASATRSAARSPTAPAAYSQYLTAPSPFPNSPAHSAIPSASINSAPSSMAISSAMSAAQPRPIHKSERPWRQRMADAARLRAESADSSASSSALSLAADASTAATSTAKLLRVSRHQHQQQPDYGGGKSSTLVAIQQRKLQESAEQLLHTQLAELRSIVADDKAGFRYGRRALVANDTRGAPSRRDSSASSFSTASTSRSSVSSSIFAPSLSSMPSAIRARQNAAATAWGATSLYAESTNIHPPTSSTFMSRSYSPIRSSTVFLHSTGSKCPKTTRGSSVSEKWDKSDSDCEAPLAVMETSTISSEANVLKEKEEPRSPEPIKPSQTKTAALAAQNAAAAKPRLSITGEAVAAPVKAETPAEQNRAKKTANESKANEVSVEKADEAKPKETTTVKRVLKISVKRKDYEDEKPNETPKSNERKEQMVCESENGTGTLAKPKTGLSKQNSVAKKSTTTNSIELENNKIIIISTKRAKGNGKSEESAHRTEVAPTEGEDESQYNAVTQFKPASAALRRKSTPKSGVSKTNSANSATGTPAATAPVPGTWSPANDVRCISQNRHLRRKPTVVSVEVVCKHFPRENPSPKSLRETSPMKIGAARTADVPQSLILLKTNAEPKPLKSRTEVAKPKKLANALAVLNSDFSNKKRFRLGIQKIIRLHGLKVEKVHLKCCQEKLFKRVLALNIVFREQNCDATVTIFSAIVTNVNSTRAHANFSAVPRPPRGAKFTRKPISVFFNKENIAKPGATASDKQKEPQLEKTKQCAAKKEESAKIGMATKETIKNETNKFVFTNKSASAAGQRPAFVQNTHIPFSSTKQQKEDPNNKTATTKRQVNYTVIPFVLPNESLLEEYVQRKRSELERSASFALNANTFNANVALDAISQSSASTSRCESPPSASSSNASVLVHIPIQQFNNPSGKTGDEASGGESLELTSAHSKAKVRTPKITDADLCANEKMIELLFYNDPTAMATASSNKAEKQTTAKPYAVLANEQQKLSFSNLSKNLKKPVDVVRKVNVFDTPKSLFEERMQSQAAQLRRTSAAAASTATTAALSSANAGATLPASFPVVYEESGENTPDSGRRRFSNEKQTVAQNFTAAIASQQPRHQHERYAAHIPLSGRQSTTSIDSSNSGALDSASRSIDQMIDQARHRHQQQQTQPPASGKFKEAIDYLDQIFEDLRKECDAPILKSNGTINHKSAKTMGSNTLAASSDPPNPPHTNGVNSSRTLPKSLHQHEQRHGQQRMFSANEEMEPDWKKRVGKEEEQQQKMFTFLKEQQKAKNGVRSKNDTQPLQQKQQPAAAKNSKQTAVVVLPEVPVSEMISLSKVSSKKSKENRLDFTRKWLVDDIKSWGADEKHQDTTRPDLIMSNDGNQEKFEELDGKNSTGDLRSLSDDSDHSLGSCSAEVAAINASEKRRQKPTATDQTPDLIKTTKAGHNNKKYPPRNNNKSISKTNDTTKTTTTASSTEITTTGKKVKHNVVVIEPIRPQPYRPHPSQLGHTSALGSSDYDLHKVSSTEKLNGARYSGQNRASSQDHHSLGSAHSQEGLKPTTSFLSINSLQRAGGGSIGGGAFVNYPQRGSIQSLPDAALMQDNNAKNNKGPTLTLGTLGQVEMSAHSGKSVYGQHHQRQLTEQNFAAELELDTLVAELELNTHPTNVNDSNDKRRSFPTMQAEIVGTVTATAASMKSAATTAATATAAARTTSMGRRNVYPLKPNAASVGTVVGHAAGIAEPQQQQQKRLNCENFANPQAAQKVSNGGGHAISTQNKSTGMVEVQTKRRNFRIRQKSGVDAPTSTKAEEKAHGPQQQKQPQQLQQQQRKFSGGSAGSGSVEKASTSAGNPFETINQERLKPSRVEAIQHMFEKSDSGKDTNAWPRKISRHDSSKDEPLYCEIGEFKRDSATSNGDHAGGGDFAAGATAHSHRHSEKPKLRSVNIHPIFRQTSAKVEKHHHHHGPTVGEEPNGHANVRFRNNTYAGVAQKKSATVTLPAAFTTAQPPSTAPPKRPQPPPANAPTASDEWTRKVPAIVTTPAAGGGGEQSAKNNGHSRSDSLFGQASAANDSRSASLLDDGDDGFYDNIRADPHHLSSSAMSEMGENTSLLTQHPPPPSSTTLSIHKNGGGGRQLIGKLIRRIGGGGGEGADSRPPTSAASLVSLNKVGNEGALQSRVGLMKSNSLSYEPWKAPARVSTESVYVHSEREEADKNGGGFGNRLKHTIFGSKKRLSSHS